MFSQELLLVLDMALKGHKIMATGQLGTKLSWTRIYVKIIQHQAEATSLCSIQTFKNLLWVNLPLKYHQYGSKGRQGALSAVSKNKSFITFAVHWLVWLFLFTCLYAACCLPLAAVVCNQGLVWFKYSINRIKPDYLEIFKIIGENGVEWVLCRF